MNADRRTGPGKARSSGSPMEPTDLTLTLLFHALSPVFGVYNPILHGSSIPMSR